jgi:GT2 family glycosyltransferase
MHKISLSLVLFNTSIEDVLRLVNESMNLRNLSQFYIIDNSPSKSELKFEDDKVTYIFTGKNLGYGAGHNVAIRDAIKIGSEFHVVINPDIYFDFQDLERMIQHMIENPLIGHLMPRITNQEGELQYMCKTLPSPVDLFLRSFAKSLISESRDQKYHLKMLDYTKDIEAPYLSGCFMILRVEALKEIGLFDERFFMYPEDIDLTRRMTLKHKTVYFPNVSVIHRHEKASFKSMKMKLIHMKNMIKYFNKYGWVIDINRYKLNKKAINQVQK